MLKKELTAQLRTARRMRHPKSHNAKSGQGHILDMVSIRERPAEIEDRAVPGHHPSLVVVNVSAGDLIEFGIIFQSEPGPLTRK